MNVDVFCKFIEIIKGFRIRNQVGARWDRLFRSYDGCDLDFCENSHKNNCVMLVVVVMVVLVLVTCVWCLYHRWQNYLLA